MPEPGLSPDPLYGPQAVHPRHLNVHQAHIRPLLLGAHHRLAPIARAGLTAVAMAQEQVARALRLYAAEPFHRPADGLQLDNLSYRAFDQLMRRIRHQIGARLPDHVAIIALEKAVIYALEVPPTDVSHDIEHR